MIVSASRRTDLPAYHLPWLLNRLKEGYALVRSPYAPHRVTRVDLRPEAVDGLVLWSKDPRPLLPHLDALEPYPWYLHFTLTGYGKEVEPGLPPKDGVLVPAFQELGRRTGRERLIWRYDPILITETYTPDWHLARFTALAEQLHPYTELCTVSFLDDYKHIRPRMAPLRPISLSPDGRRELMAALAETARRFGLRLAACAEEEDYPGVERAACIDPKRLERISGWALDVPKASGQRSRCGCGESVDIGTYNTCPAGCRYCYACRSAVTASCDPDSPLLGSVPTPLDQVTQLPPRSFRTGQLSLF